MDKNWMHIKDRRRPEYLKGIDIFLDFAFSNPSVGEKIKCPCYKCNNIRYKSRDDVKGDLLRWGMVPHYTHWIFHGESSDSSDDDSDSDNEVNDEMNDDAQMLSMLHDMHRGSFIENMSGAFDEVTFGHDPEEPNEEAKRFYKLLQDAEKKMYPDCEFSKLSFAMHLLELKCHNGWSNISCDRLLKFLKRLLPKGNLVPDSFCEAQKTIKDLGLDYIKIDACINDCILFRHEYANLDECLTCGESRWKVNPENSDVNKRKRKKIPNKIARYFPLKPRLQRLFMSKKTAENMRWHRNKRVNDGVLRHPADSLAWKHFDAKYKDFSAQARNVRLGIASDGFNPFGIMSSSYSMWPVVLIPYNLPPWECMRQPNFLLSILIPGPKGPGNDIDVYLQPLIEELKELWDMGIVTYDASLQQNFRLHAAILWSINDFPAYGMLSGWSTKGKLACPCCHVETDSCWLKHGHKQCYMGHRRFLPDDHPWRKNKSSFNGKKEERPKPRPLTGDEVLAQYSTFSQVTFGKITRKRKRGEDLHHNWKKKSIFFELPYWRIVLLRHNLDPMHIEGNISDSVVGTLLDIDGKTKDTLKARLDLQLMGIMKPLHPKRHGDRFDIDPARYTMSKVERTELCQIIKDVKFPDAYASNIGRCVNVEERKISGLKSHDHHVLFERILPLAIKELLPKDACEPLIELSIFFSDLCSKELKLEDLNQLEKMIPVTLCKLERIFPPAIFDVMVHLPIHLVNEAKLGGPVQYRWMYPIERYLRTLKGYVRNKARPEGSIAEGYLLEECMNFCSRYMTDVETKLTPIERNADLHVHEHGDLSVFNCDGRPLGGGAWDSLSRSELQQAHFYILQNCQEVQPWIKKHLEILVENDNRNVEKRHKEQFSSWFENEVVCKPKKNVGPVTNQLLALARGPDCRVFCHNGYIMNGFRFRTKKAESHLKTQNSGVVVRGDVNSGNADYHGVIQKILELRYVGNNSVILFQCDWFEVPPQGRSQSRGYKKDNYGYISIDFTRLHYADDPFVLGSQAKSVYYVRHGKHENWHTVVQVRPRNAIDLPEDENDQLEPYQLNELADIRAEMKEFINENDVVTLRRDDIDGLSIDSSIVNQAELEANMEDDDIDTDTDTNDEIEIGSGEESDAPDDIEDDDWP